MEKEKQLEEMKKALQEFKYKDRVLESFKQEVLPLQFIDALIKYDELYKEMYPQKELPPVEGNMEFLNKFRIIQYAAIEAINSLIERHSDMLNEKTKTFTITTSTTNRTKIAEKELKKSLDKSMEKISKENKQLAEYCALF